jgi:hypothetical protein
VLFYGQFIWIAPQSEFNHGFTPYFKLATVEPIYKPDVMFPLEQTISK